MSAELVQSVKSNLELLALLILPGQTDQDLLDKHKAQAMGGFMVRVGLGGFPLAACRMASPYKLQEAGLCGTVCGLGGWSLICFFYRRS